MPIISIIAMLVPIESDSSEVVINDWVLNLKKLIEMSEIVTDREHAAKGKNERILGPLCQRKSV